MEITSGPAGREAELIALFSDSFSTSERAEEGAVIGALVADMMAMTPAKDLYVFSAIDPDEITGAIMFSRLTFAQDARVAFILSPVAVAPHRQKTGIGQALILFGLETLRQDGVDYAFTYGDPAYYTKVGFRQITEDFAPAPLVLSQPQGWLGQSLSGQNQPAFASPSRCVTALSKQAYW
jgi:putative acetyltransferase